jgi:hypothetical protein
MTAFLATPIAIPAPAGLQSGYWLSLAEKLDSRLRGNDRGGRRACLIRMEA